MQDNNTARVGLDQVVRIDEIGGTIGVETRGGMVRVVVHE